VIIGAGPAGLTAACEQTRFGLPSLVLEPSGTVGGLARTENYHGTSFWATTSSRGPGCRGSIIGVGSSTIPCVPSMRSRALASGKGS